MAADPAATEPDVTAAPGRAGGPIVHLPRGRRAEPPRAAVFLDRDGVLVEDVHYLRRPEDLRLLDGAAEALRLLRARFALVVVTNQSGIARGLFDEAALLAIHARLVGALAAEGAWLDAIYACPHLPEGEVAAFARACACRKPRPGLLLDAAEAHGLSLSNSWMIGDSARDVEAGRRAGARALLLGPGGPRTLLEAADEVSRG